MCSLKGSVRCFNEAGAKSAGKHGEMATWDEMLSYASMRPAQKAPENQVNKERVKAAKELQ